MGNPEHEVLFHFVGTRTFKMTLPSYVGYLFFTTGEIFYGKIHRKIAIVP